MHPEKRILIVDDDIDDQHLFCEAIKTKYPEFDCQVASDALEAVKMVENFPVYDFIFLDLHMPKVDGFECLRLLNLTKKSANTPIIILSTSSRIEDIERCMALGASTYLIKSPTFQGLVAMLKNVLSEVATHQFANNQRNQMMR